MYFVYDLNNDDNNNNNNNNNNNIPHHFWTNRLYIYFYFGRSLQKYQIIPRYDACCCRFRLRGYNKHSRSERTSPTIILFHYRLSAGITMENTESFKCRPKMSSKILRDTDRDRHRNESIDRRTILYLSKNHLSWSITC